MRWSAIVASVLVAVLGASGGAAGASARPSLSVASSNPLRFHGAHFVARERVKVTFRSATSKVLTVRTSATGTFTVTAPGGFALDQCSSGGLVVSATGVRGDAALFRRPPRECAPAAPSSAA